MLLVSALACKLLPWAIPRSNFTTLRAMCNARLAMMKNLFALCLAPLALSLAGCASTTVTNLTATQQPRNPNNLYLIEYQWDTTRQSVRPDSIKPVVISGFETYEMRPVFNMSNRWEALVPIPADKNSFNYSFKVEYEYNRFGKPGRSNVRSPDYTLSIK